MESMSTWASASVCDCSIPTSHMRRMTGSLVRKVCASADAAAPRAASSKRIEWRILSPFWIMWPMDIARRRLAAQHLTHPTLTDAAEVVRLLGAVQSQDYAGAKWAIGMRSRGVNDASVERAFNEGRIIRTHVLRPTWHFVDPGDVRWMLALTAPRIKAAMTYYDRKLELDDALFRQTNAVIERALRDGKQATRGDLAEALRRARVDVTAGQRLGHIMLRAELDAVVCSGARRGKQF